MPLPCTEELKEEQFSYEQAVSEALVKVVQQGVQEDRVTCGIQQCVQLLASCPEDVMLCLLAKLSASQDAALKVPLLLLRAYCQENAINVLHMLGESKMTQLTAASCLLGQSAKPSLDDVTETAQIPMPVQEEGCIMIKYPKHNTSVEDDMVAAYIKQKEKKYIDPSITIPDLSQPHNTSDEDDMVADYIKERKYIDPSVTIPDLAQSHNTSVEDDLVADYIKERKYIDPSVTIPDLAQSHSTSVEDDLVADYIKEKEKNDTDPSVTIPDLAQPGVDQTMGNGFKLKKQKMKKPIQASF